MDPVTYSYHDANRPSHFDTLWRSILSLLPAPSKSIRILDLGCGNGYWANALNQAGFTVVAVDPSESGIRLAREAFPSVRFEVLKANDDLHKVLGEKSFDYVISLEVVEHLYQPSQWAEACRKALRPGGRLICSTPYHGYWKNLALSIVGKWDHHFSPEWEGGHIKFWSKRSLSRFLERAGFDQDAMIFKGAGRLPYLWNSMIFSIPLAA